MTGYYSIEHNLQGIALALFANVNTYMQAKIYMYVYEAYLYLCNYIYRNKCIYSTYVTSPRDYETI